MLYVINIIINVHAMHVCMHPHTHTQTAQWPRVETIKQAVLSSPVRRPYLVERSGTFVPAQRSTSGLGAGRTQGAGPGSTPQWGGCTVAASAGSEMLQRNEIKNAHANELV